MRERKCRECPAFYEVREEGVGIARGDWKLKQIDGKDVVCCWPRKTSQPQKPMQQFCYYCMATSKAKKIGHKASWTGRTPKWCPLGRDLPEENG